jgi:hypothetical protein
MAACEDGIVTEETALYIAEMLIQLYDIRDMDERIGKDELSYAIRQAAEECGE